MERTYDDHPDFNEALDAEGPIEICGAPFYPSDVLFKLDPEAYEAALLEWQDQERERLLDAISDLREIRENGRRIDDLIGAAQRGAIVPFVGAGLTVPCGMPAWTQFLVESAVHAGLVETDVRTRLARGQYEEVAEEVVNALGPARFDDLVDGKFGGSAVPTGAILHLPAFATGCVITTNFDELLERAYEAAGAPFTERIVGCSQTGFRRALADREHHLLKLHGSVRDSRTRVLTLAEYKAAYGDGTIDYTQELPKTLKKAFTSARLLFIGCSLATDRTLTLFQEVLVQEGHEDIPRHYAILEHPGDDQLLEREKFLGERSIFPIWFPTGEYACIEAVTAVLANALL